MFQELDTVALTHGIIIERIFKMTTLTIRLPDTQLSELEETANKLGVSVEDLIRVSIDELLSKPDTEFEAAVSYVLQKNTELYRQLVRHGESASGMT